jgi:4-hydroxythreonine-4-phosphate dehydrogenase
MNYLMSKITLAVTLGDPGGIGPEIALKAAYGPRWPNFLKLALVGYRGTLAREARRLRLPLPPKWIIAKDKFAPARVVNVDPGEIPLHPFPAGTRSTWRPGITGRTQGQAAADWIRYTAIACFGGLFDGMITGPVSKKSLQLAGIQHPGHTEFLAAITHTRQYAMMLIGEPLRVVLVTRHLPLSRVAQSVTRAGIVETAVLTARALRWLGVKTRTIGVCALNPHAGDQGMLGREEIATIIPAIRRLRRQGIKVEGPIPADVIFHQAMRGRYGAVLAMYHDQGLGPLKMIAFERGINVTLGLPIIRTSPDHGTAFDIAGKGIADPRSMIAAIRLAARLAQRKNPWLTRQKQNNR